MLLMGGPPCACPCPASVAEGLKEGEGKRRSHYAPLRVPLHGKGESGRFGHAEGFDEAIRRRRFNPQIRPQ